MGWQIDDIGRRISWRDLKAVINQRRDDSALSRSFDPDWRWTPQMHLLAGIFDQLAGANWQRGSGKKKDMPKPLPRPGVEPEVKHHKPTAVPLDEFKRRREARRQARVKAAGE